MTKFTQEYSIIVPTHNRHEKLSRLLRFLQDKKVDTIVVDSSSELFKASQPDHISYFHTPDKSFFEKVQFACEQTSSQYTFLLPDDDFPVIENIANAVASQNGKINALVGEVADFFEEFDGQFYFGKQNTFVGFVNSENVQSFFGNYSQVLWSLYDREFLSTVMSELQDIGFANENFIEMFLVARMSSSVGFRKHKGLFLVRELTESEHWGTKHQSLHRSYEHSPTDFLLDFFRYSRAVNCEVCVKGLAAYLASCRVQDQRSVKHRIARLINKVTQRRFALNYLKNSVPEASLPEDVRQYLSPGKQTN